MTVAGGAGRTEEPASQQSLFLTEQGVAKAHLDSILLDIAKDMSKSRRKTLSHMEIEDFLCEISSGSSSLDTKRQSILPSTSLISYDIADEILAPTDLRKEEDEYDLMRRFCKVIIDSPKARTFQSFSYLYLLYFSRRLAWISDSTRLSKVKNFDQLLEAS